MRRRRKEFQNKKSSAWPGVRKTAIVKNNRFSVGLQILQNAPIGRQAPDRRVFDRIPFGISVAAADIPVFIRIVRIEIFPIVKPVESQVIIFRNHGRFMVLFTINLNRKTRLHEAPIMEGAIIHRFGALAPCGTTGFAGQITGLCPAPFGYPKEHFPPKRISSPHRRSGL